MARDITRLRVNSVKRRANCATKAQFLRKDQEMRYGKNEILAPGASEERVNTGTRCAAGTGEK